MDAQQRIEVLEREIIELKKKRSMLRQQMSSNHKSKTFVCLGSLASRNFFLFKSSDNIE